MNQNESMELCLYYEEKTEDNKIERAFKIVSLFELSQLKLNNINELYQLQGYTTIEKKIHYNFNLHRYNSELD